MTGVAQPMLVESHELERRGRRLCLLMLVVKNIAEIFTIGGRHGLLALMKYSKIVIPRDLKADEIELGVGKVDVL